MIKLGDLDFTSIKQGSTDIIAVYLADEMIWGGSQPSTDFDVRLTLTGGTTSSVTYSDGIIPQRAFRQNSAITRVEIESGITQIGQSAFAYCSAITDVEIGENVTSIGADAFYYCTALSSVSIPNSVTTIGDEAFMSCNSLSSLTIGNGVTSIGDYALQSYHLSSITCNAVTAPSLGTSVFASLPSVGTLYVPYGSDYSSWVGSGATSSNQLASGWTISYMRDYSKEYLTFEAIEDGTFTFTGNSMQYSVDDGNTWTTLASNTASPTVTAGNKILWKQTNPTITTAGGIGRFISSGKFNVEGNVMSLYYGDNFMNQTALNNDNVFLGLFYGCSNLISAENLVLPATTLSNNCYRSMFYGCTSLTTAPALPATTLADECYSFMFASCTSLTTAPQLQATTLANYCYNYMFKDCTSLTTAPELLATTLVTSCYSFMFQGCTSLTTAPELIATTLASQCYYSMFNNCTSLNYIKCLATNISASNCLTNWVSGVASSGTFVKSASMTSWTNGNNGIPNGWTVQDAV